MMKILDANLRSCGLRDRAELLNTSVERASSILAERGERFDGVFLDPPYERGWLEQTMSALPERNLLAEGAWVMAEHHGDEAILSSYGELRLTQTRSYGKTSLTLFVRS